MTREEAARELTIEYQRQREADERALEMRRLEAEARDPRLGELSDGGASLLRQAARTLLTRPDEAVEAMKTARARAEGMQSELKARLVAAGLPENYLEMQYRCPICRDTGFIADPIQRHCDCFVKRLNQKMYEGAGLTGRAEQSFEAFDEQFVPDTPVEGTGKTQREIACLARDRCQRYAARYPDTLKPGLMLMGNSGLGKSFLLNCVARRLIERGFSPVKLTAYRLFEAMRGAGFGDEQKAREFDRLMSAEILLIDDLGTEPMVRNITVEYLFSLINERTGGGMHTVIATNLSFEDLKNRYTERIASRLLDKTGFEVVGLAGEDLRLIGRRRS